MTSRINITAVIAARNEETNIQACIESAQLVADAVLVVDDRSSDRTVELAQLCGATVVPGTSPAGNVEVQFRHGFLHVSTGFILRMDADERLSEGFAREVLRVVQIPGVCGVRYARRYFFFDGWLDHGNWLTSSTLGLFRADAWDKQWSCGIHTQVPVHGPVVTIPADPEKAMLHLDYFKVCEFVQRGLVRYAQQEARERFESGATFSLATFFWRPLRKILGRVLIRRAYRDGRRGIFAAYLLGVYEFFVLLYLWELNRTQAESDGDC